MAFKMRGFSAFTKKTDDKEEYTPQSTDKDKKESYPQSKYNPEMTPQSNLSKMSIGELEGHIEGTFDNEYFEAKQDKNEMLMKRYERRMLKYKKELDRRGENYTHIDMSNFG